MLLAAMLNSFFSFEPGFCFLDGFSVFFQKSIHEFVFDLGVAVHNTGFNFL